MGIRRKNITPRRRENIEKSLARRSPREVYEALRNTRDRVSLSTVYKIRRESQRKSAVGGVVVEQIKAAEHEQELTEETSHAQQANEKEKLVALIPKWQLELATYSLVPLLQWWLNKTDEGASIRYYTYEDVEKLYPESGNHHPGLPRARPLSLQVEKDSRFVLLRQKSSASDIWTLFDSWREQTIPYATALFSVLERVRRILVCDTGMPASTLREMGLVGVTSVDGIGTMVSERMSQFERRAMVLLTCDLLIAGIAELPRNSCWTDLVNELRELHVRMNLDLSTLTEVAEEGSWLGRIRGLGARLAESPNELGQKLLEELAEWQPTQHSLLEALAKLESSI